MGPRVCPDGRRRQVVITGHHGPAVLARKESGRGAGRSRVLSESPVDSPP